VNAGEAFVAKVVEERDDKICPAGPEYAAEIPAVSQATASTKRQVLRNHSVRCFIQ